MYGRDKVRLSIIGKRGFNHFKRTGMAVEQVYIELNSRYCQEISAKILNNLTAPFLSGEVDEVYMAYTYFESAARHKPTIEKLLNIDSPVARQQEYIFEPGINEILKELIPVYLENKMKSILLNSFAAEQSARIMAMSEAKENTKELLEGLILLRNKVRQANITQEMMEIISSAETLG
jgi:F-type H+-transporting ATPase subunit gamma